MKAIASLAILLLAMTVAPSWAQNGPIALLPPPPPTRPPPTRPPGNPGSDGLFTTTDSPDYCRHLQGQVNEQMRDNKDASGEEAQHLSREGERLCANGQTRSGIQHLRNAYRMLRVPAARTMR